MRALFPEQRGHTQPDAIEGHLRDTVLAEIRNWSMAELHAWPKL